jgi:hypothetical protein
MTEIEAEGAHEQWRREAEEFHRHVGAMTKSGFVMTELACDPTLPRSLAKLEHNRAFCSKSGAVYARIAPLAGQIPKDTFL